MEYELITCLELEVNVFANVRRVRLPPQCSDPDHPSYSDPGDPGEKEVTRVTLRNRKTGEGIDITDCLTKEDLEYLSDEVYEDAFPEG
jgi:hypothetical protein